MNDKLREELLKKIKEADHKQGVNRSDWDNVLPDLLFVADWFINYCDHLSLRCQITRIIDKPIAGVSVSDSHNRRAFDASVIGWTDADARECAFQANRDINSFGAVSKRDGKRRVAVFEPREFDKNGKIIKERHFHFQVAKKINET
jgi:hypothetical protein